MSRLSLTWAGALTFLTLAAPLPAAAQFGVDLTNKQGATFPCVGIGPIGGPVAESCGNQLEQEGFVRNGQLGTSGLTLGRAGASDGVVTAIEPGSPAASAGLAVGDMVTGVDGPIAAPTPGAMATKQVFGPRGDKLKLTIRRAGASQDLTFARTPQSAPATTPKSSNMLMQLSPLIDADGDYISCLGVGPAGLAAIPICVNRFRPFGYIRVSELGAVGFDIDQTRADAAVVASVQPGSPAAKAGLQAGDEITAVNGAPLSASLGEIAAERLFGKSGATRAVVVRRGGSQKAVTLTLAPAKTK